MNPADETAAKIEAPESTSAPADFGHKLDARAVPRDFDRPSDQHRPVEDLHSLLLRISHHLDYETSERSTIYYRLLAIDAQAKRIENQTKRRVLRTLVRYSVAICWSPEAKQMIASWVQERGWTNPPPAGPETAAVRVPVAETPQAIPVAQTAPEVVAPKAPATPSVDPEQVQQIMQGLAALQQTVEQLAGAQDRMARQITSLQASDSEILKRVPAPPPLPPAAPARKPIQPTMQPTTLAPSSRAPASGR
jgi:hypothetical protein